MRRVQLSPRRAVSRARGRALRAVGAPDLPNLPSGRALARRAVRDAVPDVTRMRVTGRRPATGSCSTDRPTGRTTQLMMWLAVLLAGYLLVYVACAPRATYVPPPPTSCADRVVWHDARLRDC